MESHEYKKFKVSVMRRDSFNVRPESPYTISFEDKLLYTEKKYLLALLRKYYCRPTFKHWAFVFRPPWPGGITEKENCVILRGVSRLPDDIIDHICKFIPRRTLGELWHRYRTSAAGDLIVIASAINFLLISDLQRRTA
jgi:hypothetical protein